MYILQGMENYQSKTIKTAAAQGYSTCTVQVAYEITVTNNGVIFVECV